MRNVKCPRCGKEFVCRHDKTCFCNNYTLSENAKRDIQSKWSECLCEDCLRVYAEATEPKSECCCPTSRQDLP